ncbi:MAG TPA: LCP family protein [Candidatus Saccharimonadales bacterium]|nr:LCP family protein [Candidatus Saccharimonadales bacterium]
MNNFRKEQRRSPRQAMDGIINAPSRQQLTGQPFAKRAMNGDVFRTNQRTIGDFKRPNGYHLSNTAVSAARNKASEPERPAARPGDESLLRMTLPGSGKQDDKKNDKRRGPFGHRKNKKPPKSRLRRNLKRGGLILLALILLLGGYLFFKGYFNLHKVLKGGGKSTSLNDNVDPSLLKGEGDGRVNVLLLGRGGEGHDGADLTDTILLASIDPVNKKAALVSLPRDLWVATPYGSSKVNAVFAYAKQRAQAKGNNKKDAEAAGLKAIQDEVSEILGVTIHYRTMVDFRAFQDAVNTVGGVDINVTEDTAVTERLWNQETGKKYYLNVTPGMQHFDGERALFYARSRHTSARGDFARAERQRLLIEALSKKISSAGTYTNPVKLSNLMDNFGDHVTTDFSIDDAIRLAKLGKSIGSNFESIDLADPDKPLFTTGMIGNQSVVLPAAGQGDYSEIQAMVRSKLKDGYILKENADIHVLNGTVTAGLAGEKAEELKTYGYNVSTVTDAPTQDYEKTVIVDLTKGKKPYTKNYLEKRFGVKSTAKLPDSTIPTGTASFVIILGQNETINR